MAIVNVNSDYCTAQQELRPSKLLGYQIFWVILLLIVLMTIVGSLYDIYKKEENQSGFKSFILAFSFPSNTRRLFLASNKTENLSCIDILKTHACVLVIIGQRMLYTTGQPLQNSNNIKEITLHLLYAMVRNGSLVVDFFFIISGFLTFHFLYNELVNTKTINVPLLLFWRWLRLMPVYGLMIAFHTFVFLHLADGPLWKKIAIQESDYCRRNWWSNVLFINNYVDADHPCIIQSWYLACDMQFFIAGIALVYFVWKYQSYGVYLMWSAIFLSSAIPAAVVYAHQFYPTFMNTISPFNYLPAEHRSYTALYVPGHARAAPYFVGVFAAYVYRYLKLDRPDFRFPYPKTLAWTLVAVYPLALMTAPASYVRPYRLWLSVAYTFAYRTVFATVVSAFIIVCAVNGLVAGFWLRMVIPLSKLTYGAYLGGLSMQLMQVASMRSSTYFNDSVLLWLIIGDTVLGFILAFLLYTLIESPFDTLLKKLIAVSPKINFDHKKPTDTKFPRKIMLETIGSK